MVYMALANIKHNVWVKTGVLQLSPTYVDLQETFVV